jgi:hypothetical protein
MEKIKPKIPRRWKRRRVQGSGFMVQDSGFRIHGSGFARGGQFIDHFLNFIMRNSRRFNKGWFQQSNAAHFRSKDFTGCSVSEATTRTFV